MAAWPRGRRARLDPPGDERQHVRGGGVEPLGVVDERDHRPVPGDPVQRREPDQEPIRDGRVGRPDRGQQRVALRARNSRARPSSGAASLARSITRPDSNLARPLL
jgi:hypothetical protein